MLFFFDLILRPQEMVLPKTKKFWGFLVAVLAMFWNPELIMGCKIWTPFGVGATVFSFCGLGLGNYLIMKPQWFIQAGLQNIVSPHCLHLWLLYIVWVILLGTMLVSGLCLDTCWIPVGLSGVLFFKCGCRWCCSFRVFAFWWSGASRIHSCIIISDFCWFGER